MCQCINTHLDGLHSVDKAVESREDQERRKVPRLHHTPVPLVLGQVGFSVIVGAPEELQDLNASLHFQETV